MPLYQIPSGQGNESPRCGHCGASKWIATRPSRINKARHPQEKKSWAERAAGVFIVSLIGAGALVAIAVAGLGVMPGWLVWALDSAALSMMMCAVVAIDGMAVEAKSCAVACIDCGEAFIAPWRPSD